MIRHSTLLLVLAALAACQHTPPSGHPPPVEAIPIPLAGPLAAAKAEVSGLAWAGDLLILLPENPHHFVGGPDGALFALPREEILRFLDGRAAGPLHPRAVPLTAPGLSALAGFDGLEAIAVAGRRVYVSVEADAGDTASYAYLVAGEIAPDGGEVRLEPGRAARVPSQSGIHNISEEALLVAGSRVLAFHELYGERLNPVRSAAAFGPGLEPLGAVPFPRVEHRITDATAPDAEGRFWVANYGYPGSPRLHPDDDPLDPEASAAARGRAERLGHVERLVEMRLGGEGVELTGRAPVRLVLPPPDSARNWEGIARLEGRGMLLVTDEYPATVLAFVPVEP